MLDRVWSGGFLPVEQRTGDPLTRIADGTRRLRRYLLDHGEIAMLLSARPQPSPAMLQNAREVYALFREAGFHDDTLPLAFSTLLSYGMGSVAFAGTHGFVDRIASVDDEGQAVRLAAFEEAATLEPAERVRREAARGADLDETFDLGLRLLIDGLVRWNADGDTALP